MRQILELILSLHFLLVIAQIAPCETNETNAQMKLIMGKITEVDFAENKISLDEGDGLIINDNTLNLGTNKKSSGNIQDLETDIALILKYNTKNKNVDRFWILRNFAVKTDIMNFISLQERNSRNNIVNSYYLWEFPLQKIYEENFLYLFSLEDKRLEIRIVKNPEKEKQRSSELFQKYWEENDIITRPIVFKIRELGLKDNDKARLEIVLQEKKIAPWENGVYWKKINSVEVPLVIKKSGVYTDFKDTLAFVRDSFGTGLRPEIGVSLNIRIKFRISRRSNSVCNTARKVWNATGIAFGINATRLSFEGDDKTRLGLGWVISILDGWIYIGSGWEVSKFRRKNRYVFIGISIVDLTDNVKKILKL